MASFKDKIGWKRSRTRQNKNYRFVSFLPNAQQKIPKKLKKLKNTITDSSEAKIGGKMLRKRENKNYRSVSFLPDVEEKIPKKQQKNSKIEKHHDGFIPRKNRLENAEKGRK